MVSDISLGRIAPGQDIRSVRLGTPTIRESTRRYKTREAIYYPAISLSGTRRYGNISPGYAWKCCRCKHCGGTPGIAVCARIPSYFRLMFPRHRIPTILFLVYLLFLIQPTSQLCVDTGQSSDLEQSSDLRLIFLNLRYVGVQESACSKKMLRATGQHDFSTLRPFDNFACI